MMNTRGLIGLIVVHVGDTLGVLSKPLSGTLIQMAVITTVMTTPLLLWLRRGTELEEPMRASGFAR
jgi:Kef-type K+ transport system membrane component KefB